MGKVKLQLMNVRYYRFLHKLKTEKNKKRIFFVVICLLFITAYRRFDFFTSLPSDSSVSDYFEQIYTDDSDAMVLGINHEKQATGSSLTDKLNTIELKRKINTIDRAEMEAILEKASKTKTDSNLINTGEKYGDKTKPSSNTGQAGRLVNELYIDKAHSRKAKVNTDITNGFQAEMTTERIGITKENSDRYNKLKLRPNGEEIKTNEKSFTTDYNNKILEDSQTDKSPNSNFERENIFAQMSAIERSPFNIFFVESSCVVDKTKKEYDESGSFVLNARQCCAVESTARTNPERPVYVFHSCALSDDFVSTSAPYVGRLMSYKNVFVVRLVAKEVFRGTPVQRLYESGALEASKYPVEHSSDIIRLALLWKFGGTYSDVDVVTIKPLSTLGSNWAGMQDVYTVATGVLDVAPAGEAHQMLGEALTRVNDHYNPSAWSSNGPELLTSILLRHCAVHTVNETMTHCRIEFTVYPRRVLYPVYYTKFAKFFDERIGPKLVTSLKRTAFSVHLWNKMSHDSVATVGSQQAYSLLAKEFCPAVYASCADRF